MKTQAHGLKPVIMIGQAGLTEAVLKEIELALDTHELLKIKIRAEREERKVEYVKKAKALGYRSRATFKLIEIIEKDKLVHTGMNIVDLGAAPGGWSEYVRGIVGKKQKVVALDILDIDPIEGVDFIQLWLF
jgi:putative YhbY family RNA-binding protein